MIAEHMAQCLATLKPRQEDPGPRPMGFGVGLSAVGPRPCCRLGFMVLGRRAFCRSSLTWVTVLDQMPRVTA